MTKMETYYSEGEARKRFGRKVNVGKAHALLITAGLIAAVVLMWVERAL